MSRGRLSYTTSWDIIPFGSGEGAYHSLVTVGLSPAARSALLLFVESRENDVDRPRQPRLKIGHQPLGSARLGKLARSLGLSP